jgi:hypothetical protein
MAATMASIELEIIAEAENAVKARDPVKLRRVTECMMTYNQIQAKEREYHSQIQAEILALAKAVDGINAPIINVTS